MVLASIALVLSAWASAAASGPGEPLTASDLLQRMALAYSGCRSYRDTGIEKTVFASEVPARVEERPFRTAFVRPDRFRCEFADRGKRYIVWRSGAKVRTWWDIGSRLESPESLSGAVAGATGVSGGSAHTIPALLMPTELSGWRLSELNEVSRLPDALLGQNNCFRLEGKVEGLSETIWLDKATYFVRRIDEELPARFGAEETTTYEPVTDGDITDDLLAFDPPVSGGPDMRRMFPWALVLVGGTAVVLRAWLRRRPRTDADLGPGSV